LTPIIVEVVDEQPSHERLNGFLNIAHGHANLYVSHQGLLQTINLFDLNRDGYLDLLFNQTHDYNTRIDSVVYWNGEHG
jgi:hypothetical protein